MTTPSVSNLMETAITAVVNTTGTASATLAPAGICGVYYGGKRYYCAKVFEGTADPLPSKDSAFGLGSVTKTFTTAVIGQLGTSSIDSSIKGNIPPQFSLQSAAEEWTLSQLASFCSGLPRYPENRNGQPITNADWKTYASYLNAFVPPSLPAAYDYSNISVGLASQIAMAMNGFDTLEPKETLAWWQSNLFNPIGMSNTGAFDFSGGTDLPGDPTPGFVTPYECQSGGYNATTYSGWCPWGAAGRAYSTADDMVSFIKALVGEPTVKGNKIPKTVANGIELAETPVSPPVYVNPKQQSITQALAWVMDGTDPDQKFVFKDGGVRGVSSFITACPSLKLGAVLLTNLQGVAVGGACKALTNGLMSLANS